MSKHISGWRTHAAMAMASIRGEGWRVRRIAVDVWKVSDRRPYRWEGTRLRPRRHFLFNHTQLLDFAGVYAFGPIGRAPYTRIRSEGTFITVNDEDVPF